MRGVSARAKKMIRSKDGKFVELPEAAKKKHLMSTRNQQQPWTREDVQYLKELAKENTPTRVIGLKLGRSVASIRDQAEKIKLSLKPTNQSPYGVRKAAKTKKKSGSQSKSAR